MSSVETVKERVVDEYGNIRSEEQGYMHGGDVFNFVIREIPKDIKALLAYAETDKDEFDYMVFIRRITLLILIWLKSLNWTQLRFLLL